jgi:hypothetical protein
MKKRLRKRNRMVAYIQSATSDHIPKFKPAAHDYVL